MNTMKPTIIFVTGNEHKAKEVQQALPEFEIIMKKISLTEIQGTAEDIIRAKVVEATSALQQPVIVDDSCVHITAFNGFPGQYAADYCKTVGNKRTLTMLQGFTDRTASMVSHAAYGEPGNEPVIFVGEVQGRIAEDIRGEEGFGVDPIFIPEDEQRTFGEMTTAEKNQKNHRARSFKQLAVYLRSQLNNQKT
jgi:non-canonical purine NTP pyrophosphatase (RdgB/HAM1 family)